MAKPIAEPVGIADEVTGGGAASLHGKEEAVSIRMKTRRIIGLPRKVGRGTLWWETTRGRCWRHRPPRTCDQGQELGRGGGCVGENKNKEYAGLVDLGCSRTLLAPTVLMNPDQKCAFSQGCIFASTGSLSVIAVKQTCAQTLPGSRGSESPSVQSSSTGR